MKKWLIAGSVLVVLVICAVVWSQSASADDKNELPKTVAVKLGTLVDKALATGEILPRHEIQVKSKISGTVSRLFVAEGDRVRIGDPLLEIKPNPTPLEYAQKKRALEIRALVEKQRAFDLTRAEGLFEKGMASKADCDAAREAAEQATLIRKMAEEELAILDKGKTVVAGRSVESIIASPIAGQVLSLPVNVGDPVVPLTSYQPGTALLSIGDMENLLMRGTVDEIDVGKIKEGMRAEIKVGARPEEKVTGVLQRISIKSHKTDNSTVFDLEIGNLSASPDVYLRAGYSANADVIIRQVTDVPLLPERVIVFRNDSTLVRIPGQSDDLSAE
ncbi:MAG: efflux RND transporter periplasmic adaptor subunit [bacterium]|nr:efflux RND transporter periplasmic adaptor subunit [bacterium]